MQEQRIPALRITTGETALDEVSGLVIERPPWRVPLDEAT
jgi:hypothetical protein